MSTIGRPIRDLRGKKFERLTVQEKICGSSHGIIWLCLCTCGNTVKVLGTALTRGSTKSCGCLQTENRLRHGYMKRGKESKTYRCWIGMIARCYNTKHAAYHNYGARGITVCDRWLTSFENFLADMGEMPQGMSLERKDNNLGYNPDNCCWATHLEQGNNKRTNRLVTYYGETHTISEWARILEIPINRLFQRLYNGWEPEKALSTPAQTKTL